MTSADFSTCDLCDAHKGAVGTTLRVLPPVFRDYGGAPRFSGALMASAPPETTRD